MQSITEGLRDVFFAGLGAMALGAEKSRELINQLIARGEITAEQGEKLAEQLVEAAEHDVSGLQDSVLKTHMSLLSKEQREQYVAKVAQMAEEANAKEEAAERERSVQDTVVPEGPDVPQADPDFSDEA